MLPLIYTENIDNSFLHVAILLIYFNEREKLCDVKWVEAEWGAITDRQWIFHRAPERHWRGATTEMFGQ